MEHERSTVESDHGEDEDLHAEPAAGDFFAQLFLARAMNNEEAIQSLQELRSRYHADIERNYTLDIGDCVKEICRYRYIPRHSNVIPFRTPKCAATCAVMQFVLEQIPHGDSTLNEMDNDGNTPLDLAIQAGSLECVELLLERGANSDSVNALDIALKIEEFNRGPELIRQVGAIFKRNNLMRCWQVAGGHGNSLKISSTFWGRSYARNDNVISMSFSNNIARSESAASIAEGGKLWIHVPITSISILISVASMIDDHLYGQSCRYRGPGFSWLLVQNFHLPTIVPSNSLLSYQDILYSASTEYSGPGGNITVIVFPCLILDTIRRVLHERRVHGSLKPLPGYGGGIFDEDVGICLDQTLDESYYPSLDQESREARNRDQVVSKEYLRTFGGEVVDCPILMVPPLWIWGMDGVLLSACSEINCLEDDFMRNSSEAVVRKRNRYDSGSGISMKKQIGVLLAASVNKFGMRSPHGEFKPPLDMFEAALTSTFSAVHSYLKADKSDIRTREQKRKELEFIHHISDIHSELDMIQYVLNQQKEVMDKYIADTKVEREAEKEQVLGTQVWKEVQQARETLDKYSDRIHKIHKDADRAEKTINSFLNLQRTYANIEDTQNNMLVGLAALAFAIVTVIFTPLSFMTSLFALPVREIVQHQKTINTSSSPSQAPSQAFDFKYISGYIALAGFATWIPTGILLAFLYLRWTGHFGRQQSRTEPKKDDATDTSDTDAKDGDVPKVRPWAPLQEGLRRRWNVLTGPRIGAQASEENVGPSTSAEDSGKQDASKATPQASDAEGSKRRKKDTSIV